MVENTGREIEDVVMDLHSGFFDWLPDIRRVREGYVKRKLDSNSMDFDDLLVLTVRLFEARGDLLALYQKRFRHVLVDKYRNTNTVQSRLIDLLAGAGASLMAVGDDAQSIYSWRGADMGHILGFRERYPEARVFTIETNYRSVPEILDLSNEAIRANEGRIEKDLRAVREASGVKPALVALTEPRAQAMFVAQRIQELRDTGDSAHRNGGALPGAFPKRWRCRWNSRCGVCRSRSPADCGSSSSHIKDVAAFLRFVVNRRGRGSFVRDGEPAARLRPGGGGKAVARVDRCPAWPERNRHRCGGRRFC